MRFHKNFKIITLGCKVNQYESDKIRAKFLDNGYTEDSDQPLTVCVINSCTVTHIADKKTRSLIRKIKRQNSDIIIVVTGCYVQTDGKLLAEIPEVNLLVDNTQKETLFQRVVAYETALKQQALDTVTLDKERVQTLYCGDIFSEKKYAAPHENAVMQEHTRAYIKIQDGCNNFCSYCKIPFARGKSRSRALKDIVNEVVELSEKGYKEFVIIGINLSQYGADLIEDEKQEKIDLTSVLTALNTIEGVKRIRIGSIYPEQITDEFLTLVKNTNKVMPHFHLSLQSGCDATLYAMKRHYTAMSLHSKIEQLQIIENVSITADIIVGFPTETETDFLKTQQFIRDSSLTNCHVFPYSKRENTVAASMPFAYHGDVLKGRMADMLTLSDEKFDQFLTKQVGKVTTILIEKIENNRYVGYSENYIMIKVSKPIESTVSENSIIKVKITSKTKTYLEGVVWENS